MQKIVVVDMKYMKMQNALRIAPVFFTLFLITACGPSEAAVQNAIMQTQSAITLTSTYAPLPTTTNTPVLTPTSDYTATPEPLPTLVPTNTPSIKVLTSIDDYIQIPNKCNISIDSIQFSRTILPPNTSGYYRYYEAKDPSSTFLDVEVTVTNLGTVAKSVQDLVSIRAIYDDVYNYYAAPVVVDDDGSFSYSLLAGVQPLLSKTAHYLLTVPNQVESSNKTLVIIITVADQEYHYFLCK